MSLKRKDRPLYLQIKHIIKDRILHGVYPLDSVIPPEPQLEKEFGVSKITVRGAVQELVQEGYLEKGSGRGTRVVRNTVTSKLSKWKHFTEILVEEGHKIRKQWLGLQQVKNEPGSKPFELFGPLCLKLRRIYYLNDVPYIYYEHYVSPAVDGLEDDELDGRSLYELLEEQGITLDKLRDEFAAELPSAEIADMLKLKEGTPVLKRTRYSFDGQGQVAELSFGYYHTAKQSYVVNYEA
ncbi:GntR family transcriptional regulator [Paenibacillus physcomitrellae]|uniref:GntR family transcriptional regulator n=1 Tax=Paenibacillus physcomitrellae TaxID=1619311 RepID=A0ABQ1FQ98_9BACL|nr:GntR family transcriptional regulator [Paenibacillus physcomitrellae]GGA26326.1 GntR family transcriptional regulator [Paenibacillus physcomitrellae]